MTEIEVYAVLSGIQVLLGVCEHKVHLCVNVIVGLDGECHIVGSVDLAAVLAVVGTPCKELDRNCTVILRPVVIAVA